MFDITVVMTTDEYVLITAMEDFEEDVWLYSTKSPNTFAFSEKVLGPDERESLGLTFIISTGQLRS